MASEDLSLAELESVLRARQGRREGREIRFLCPVHADRRPSARWNPDKRTWYCDVCQHGGGWRDLADRLGLDHAPVRGSPAEIEAVYDYRDREGFLRFQVLRKRGKVFTCRRPLPGGGWAWNLTDVERVLYRLPDTLAAIGESAPVFVVEGEKDADRLAAFGVAATTNPGGAGKWRPCYSEALRGARVVILPDHDTAGDDHARAVRESLEGLAAEVRLLLLPGLPEKGDVSDWIAARETAGLAADAIRRELLDLAAAAGQGAPPAASPRRRRPSRVRPRSDIRPQAVSFLWHPYIPLGKLTFLEGDPGQGKSWLAAAIAASGSRGEGLPHSRPFAPFSSLFFTAEDGLADTLRPRLEALGADCSRVLAHDQPLNFASDDDLAEFEEAVGDYRPQLVVIDPVLAYLGAKTDAYRANEVRSILAPLARVAGSHACSLLAIRHLNKAKGARSIYAGQGSIDFAAAARSVLLAGCGGDDSAQHALVHIKSNLARLGAALAYTIDESGFHWAGESHLRASDLLAPELTGDELSNAEEARGFLRSLLAHGPLPTAKILAEARRAGISEITLRRAKQREGVRATRHGYGPVASGTGPIPTRRVGRRGRPDGHAHSWPRPLHAPSATRSSRA